MPVDRNPDPEDPPDDLVDVPYDEAGDGADPRRPHDDVPEIRLGPDLRELVDQSIASLAKLGDVYCRAGALVDVVHDDDGAPVIHVLKSAALRERLSVAAIYLEEPSGEKPPKRTWPPLPVVEALQARGEWPGIPTLRAAVDYPVLAPSGRIVSSPGYDTETRLWIDHGVRVPELGDIHDPAVVHAAVATLLEPFCDFQFDNKSGGLSVVVSAILSTMARAAIKGPVPLHGLDGSQPGLGKGLLVTGIGLIATGHAPGVMPYTPRPEEQEKRVIGILDRGDPICVIDDVKYPMGGAIFDPLFTAWPTFRGRRLGSNEIVAVPATTVWIATAVNLVLKDHTVRRVISARVETDRERPEERTDFRHDPFLAYVDDHRIRLRDAALTILAGYCAAGRPRSHDVDGRPLQKLRGIGSYEAWDAIVRYAIVWAGLPDPVRGRDGTRSASSDHAAIGRLFGEDGLPRLIAAKGIKATDDGKHGVTAAIIRDAVDEEHPAAKVTIDALRELRSFPRENAAQAIGLVLRSLRGRRVGDRRLDGVESRPGVIWYFHELRAEPLDREVL